MLFTVLLSCYNGGGTGTGAAAAAHPPAQHIQLAHPRPAVAHIYFLLKPGAFCSRSRRTEVLCTAMPLQRPWAGCGCGRSGCPTQRVCHAQRPPGLCVVATGAAKQGRPRGLARQGQRRLPRQRLRPQRRKHVRRSPGRRKRLRWGARCCARLLRLKERRPGARSLLQLLRCQSLQLAQPAQQRAEAAVSPAAAAKHQ